MKKHVGIITIEILLGFSMLAYASHPLGSDSFYSTLKEFIIFRDPVAEGTTLLSSLTSSDGTTLVLDPSGRVECSVLHLNANTEADIDVLKNSLEIGDMIRWLPGGSLISELWVKSPAGEMVELKLDLFPDEYAVGLTYDWFIKLEDNEIYGFSRTRQG